MIIDLTRIHDELDLFEIRYNELRGLVDYFVVVEANHTYTGNPKPWYFSNSKFYDYPDVMTLQFDNGSRLAPLTNQYTWFREIRQMSVLGDFIRSRFATNDTILLGDVDEIPKRSAVERLGTDFKGIYSLDMSLHYLYLNTAVRDRWPDFRMFHLYDLENGKSMWEDIRHNKNVSSVPDAGWHFSSCLGKASLRKKLNSFSHTEYQGMLDSHIDRAYKELFDPFHKMPLQVVPLNSLPRHVQETEKYKEYLYDS